MWTQEQVAICQRALDRALSRRRGARSEDRPRLVVGTLWKLKERVEAKTKATSATAAQLRAVADQMDAQAAHADAAVYLLKLKEAKAAWEKAAADDSLMTSKGWQAADEATDHAKAAVPKHDYEFTLLSADAV